MLKVPFRPSLLQRSTPGATAQAFGQTGRSSPSLIGRLSLAADQCHKNSPGEISRTSISAMLISCARAAGASNASTSESKIKNVERMGYCSSAAHSCASSNLILYFLASERTAPLRSCEACASVQS